jgi:hypothetical protein
VVHCLTFQLCCVTESHLPVIFFLCITWKQNHHFTLSLFLSNHLNFCLHTSESITWFAEQHCTHTHTHTHTQLMPGCIYEKLGPYCTCSVIGPDSTGRLDLISVSRDWEQQLSKRKVGIYLRDQLHQTVAFTSMWWVWYLLSPITFTW